MATPAYYCIMWSLLLIMSKSFWICESLLAFLDACSVVCELLLHAYIGMALFIDVMHCFLNPSYYKMYEGSLYREDLNIMSVLLLISVLSLQSY